MRKQLRRLIRKTGYDVHRCRPNLGQFLISRDIDLFLDRRKCGADRASAEGDGLSRTDRLV
jgi:hypothetical protein